MPVTYNIINLECPKSFWQGMTNNVRLTLSGNDTTLAVYNHYWARQIELATLIKYNI